MLCTDALLLVLCLMDETFLNLLASVFGISTLASSVFFLYCLLAFVVGGVIEEMPSIDRSSCLASTTEFLFFSLLTEFDGVTFFYFVAVALGFLAAGGDFDYSCRLPLGLAKN